MHIFQLILSVVFLAVFGSWMAYCVVSAMRTGVATAGGTTYKRSKSPFMFWAAVTGQSLFSIMFFALLALRIFKR